MLKCINFEGLGVGNEWYVKDLRQHCDILLTDSGNEVGL